MIDVFDIFAFVVFAVLLAAGVIAVVALGSLPGQIAHKRGHPQAAAVSAAGWIGLAAGGVLWPLAFIWAFFRPAPGAAGADPDPDPRPAAGSDAVTQLGQMQARVDALEAALRQLRAGKEVAS